MTAHMSSAIDFHNFRRLGGMFWITVNVCIQDLIVVVAMFAPPALHTASERRGYFLLLSTYDKSTQIEMWSEGNTGDGNATFAEQTSALGISANRVRLKVSASAKM